ncbi:MAG: hypothetical protein HY303_01000 [Candidatus Wallbacteria bacterium]|nr:hypothetical protein [Candidatus Wallbacteria bacterium]
MSAVEIHQRFVRQDVPGLRRRQFRAAKIDLSVWQNSNGDVVHFRVLVAPDRIVDFEGGSGLHTAHGVLPEFAKEGGWKSDAEPDEIRSVVPDKFIDLGSVKSAFEELSLNPPRDQKRVLKFVAHVLYQALTSPHGLLKFVEGKLPSGLDSVLGSGADAEAIRTAGENKAKFHAVFEKLRSFLSTE